MSQKYSRIIEKNLFQNQSAPLPGTSDVVDLFGSFGGSAKLSFQAVYDVDPEPSKDFNSGQSQVDTSTYLDKASTNPGDFIRISTISGYWAIYANISGADPEPNNSRWTAVPVDQRAQVNLSAIAVITDAQVASAFATAFNALVGVPFVALAAGANVTFTLNDRGFFGFPECYSGDGQGSSTITATVLTFGSASDVDTSASLVIIANHGYETGYKVQLTSTGTLPGGLATATDYYIINNGVDYVQFASTLQGAIDHTNIILTTQGSDGAVNTITGVAISGASFTFQCSNDGVNWGNVQAATNIGATGTTMIQVPNVSTRYFRAVKAITSGQFDLQGLILVLGDAT